jgi:hypothetical protein
LSVVTIKTTAAASDTGESAGFDASAFSSARLDWYVVGDLGRNVEIRLQLFDAPTANGPWREIWSRNMQASNANTNDSQCWTTTPRASLSGFDSFLKCAWSGRARQNVAFGDTTARFTIGLAGTALP